MDKAGDRGARMLDEITAVQLEINALQARQATIMLAFADHRRSEAAASGTREPASAASFAADEIAVELSVSAYRIQSRIHAARTVRDDLPLTWALHESGRLDSFVVRLIAETAWTLTRAESIASLDEKVGDYAVGHTPGQLRQWLRRFIARVEPDHVAERRHASFSDRSVGINPADDGMAWLNALMSAEDAALLDRELTVAARAARATDEDERTERQARADILVQRALGTADGGAPRGRFHVGLTMPLTSLLALGDDPAVASTGTFELPAVVARELMARPGTLFSRILTDPFGRVIDVTEIGRFPSAELARDLELVDGVCAFPTCCAPAANADADHIDAFPQGPTRGPNLIHLCRRHHRMKTRKIVSTVIDRAGYHTWCMPSGRRIRSSPHLPRAHIGLSRPEELLRAIAAAA
jgi:hypothetical protein